MKKQISKILGTALSTILLLFVLSSCETWREDCTGQIIVENEIPDTTLYVGGAPFRRDVSEPPIVFSHTEREISIIEVTTMDNDIALAGTHVNENDKAYIIFVEGRKAGRTEIRVLAKDECTDYAVATTFNVTVIDTTNN